MYVYIYIYVYMLADVKRNPVHIRQNPSKALVHTAHTATHEPPSIPELRQGWSTHVNQDIHLSTLTTTIITIVTLITIITATTLVTTITIMLQGLWVLT